jgi:hypothetical protein
MMLNALWKQSLVWIFGIGLSLTIATSVTANAPAPPSMYWLKFDSPAKLQGIQIAQCQDRDCQTSILLKQSGTCSEAGCLKSVPKLAYPKPLHVECADNLCLVALSPFYDKKELDPNQIRIIAQLDRRVSLSQIFPLGDREKQSDKFTVKVAEDTLEISPNAAEKVTDSPLFQNLCLINLLLTLAIESSICAGYLRWCKASFVEIQATILAIFIVHAFSFAIVWFSFPGLQNFASQSQRYGGLTWLVASIGYGLIVSFYVSRSQKSLSRLVVVGSIAYWLGAAFISVVISALFGYGNALPPAEGISEPIAILASEIFVVGYEAWIIQRLRRNNLDFKTALGLSLAANTASCIIGLAITLFIPR